MDKKSIKKILLATDLSPTANNALTYAVGLAKALGAVIDLIHIYMVKYEDGQYYTSSYMQEIGFTKENWALEQLEVLCKNTPTNLIGEKRVLQGLFADREIIDLSHEGLYDLLIMGTKGTSNRIERWLGSTTTRTMMEAACPVLVIPPIAQYRTIKHLTYATIYDTADLPAVEQLMTFAGQLNATVQFLHINHKKEVVPTTDYVQIPKIPNKLATFSEVSGDSVEQGITHYLAHNPVDVLALFIPQRGAWERLFHTSFTKKMVFHTDTPLLIFHQ